MQQVKDPVCGMMVDPAMAQVRSTHRGVTYYFCSEGCKRQFESDPESYVATVRKADVAATSGRDQPPLERHEPPYTKSGELLAPKFGSAGSGGAEYERLPESHNDIEEEDRPA